MWLLSLLVQLQRDSTQKVDEKCGEGMRVEKEKERERKIIFFGGGEDKFKLYYTPRSGWK